SGTPASLHAGRVIHAELQRGHNAEDRWIPLAATSAAARHDVGFLTAALSAKVNSPAVRRAVRVVAEHYARGDASKTVGSLLVRLKSAPEAEALAFLEGFSAGWPKDTKPVLDSAVQADLVAAMDHLPPTGQAQLATLAVRWGLGERFDAALAGL